MPIQIFVESALGRPRDRRCGSFMVVCLLVFARLLWDARKFLVI